MQHMGTEKCRERAGVSRAAILAAVWTLIAVTLLSALAPLGPPLSRLKGSAFNPATSEVVLKARARVMTQVAQPVRPDGDGLPPVAILCLAMALLPGLWRRPSILPAIGEANAPGRLHLIQAHRARAPPAFF
ncbi:hypothetical protein [Sphingobium lactosutens]|uniref:hypothetical protein n=1 Tax=Sphingobium lactosutens TaxID=522773 RepID=UPI00211889D6|nr:hypothetical protein [Sphingobium lactosutens]